MARVCSRALHLHSNRSLPTLAAVPTLAAAASLALAQRGVQINTHPFTGEDIIGDAGNEPTLAISPVDPNRFVVGWRQFPAVNSDARYAGFAYSSDGGLSWTNGGVLDEPPSVPNAQQSDPVLSVDSQGVFHYWSETFRPHFGQFIYASLDGGETWETPTAIEDPASGDKCWVTVDASGGIGDGHIYGGWNHFNLGGHCFVRSTDGGQSFSTPVRIADQGGTQWMLQFTVGPDGEVYAAWRNMTRNLIYVTKSLRARDPNQEPLFDAFGSGGQYGLDRTIDASNDPGFLDVNPTGFHQIYIDIDRSDGPRRGWVYCLWSDNRNDAADIHFARSADGGFTWDTGFRVNDDGEGNIQWMPAMSVAPDGRIDAVWYDTRNDPGPGTPWSEIFYSFSLDGGETWSPNRRVSDAFDTTIGWPQQEKMGDYIQGASDAGGFNFVYCGTFNGGQDLYFLRAEPTILSVSPLRGGEPGTFQVLGARPRERAYLLYSTAGLGATYIPQLNVTAGLTSVRQAGPPQTTDTNGNVAWTLPIPPGGSGREAWFQVVQRENGSNAVRAEIE